LKVIATHDVDDVQHWFDSHKRAEFFEARGMKATAFRDPAGESSSVAVLIETPDMETLERRSPSLMPPRPSSTMASASTPFGSCSPSDRRW
jgi:hypothetical protein